jgi:hypothetical protein
VVRIEDVAIGCGVSLLVGIMFWPRGVSAVVGEDLADAYRAGAAYLVQAVDWACGRRVERPDGAMATVTAASRLDEAVRGFIAEQGVKRIAKVDLWRLLGGAMRLRLTSHAVTTLPPDVDGHDDAHRTLDRRAHALAAWYEQLALALGRPRDPVVEVPPAPSLAAYTVDGATNSNYAVWLCEHLDHLAEHVDDLVAPAARLARLRRIPWWQ